MHNWYQHIRQVHQTSALFITHDIDEAIMLSDRIYIMAGPPGYIAQEITIHYPHKRDQNFTTTSEFIHYKKAISAMQCH